MNFDRASRQELLGYIDNQKEKVYRYEQRLKDIIHAYKSVAKEKEALEACVKALSTSNRPQQKQTDPVRTSFIIEPVCQDDSRQGSPSRSEQSPPSDPGENSDENKSVFTDPLGITGSGTSSKDEGDSRVGSASHGKVTEEWLQDELQARVLTLTTALTTLSVEKSKIEANYIAEKRTLRQQHDDLLGRYENLQASSELQISVLQDQLSAVKQKVRDQQLEREQEQNVHQIMLREIQRLLADERQSRLLLDEKLVEKDNLLCKYKDMTDLTEEYRNKITTLQIELDRFQQRLSASKDSLIQPSPMLIQLQQQLVHIQAQHRIQLEREQLRASEAEVRINSVTTMCEERVISLEDKLSRISEIVATYEKTRLEDQTAIQKLRDRINHLDLENAMLARDATNSSGSTNNDSNLDTDTIQKRIEHLKDLLKTTTCPNNTKSSDDLNIEDDSSRENDPIHEPCRHEQRRLKEEFEHYKNRAQSVLRSKNSKETISLNEIETLKTQVPELTEKLRQFKADAYNQRAEHSAEVERMRELISNLKENHKKTLTDVDTRYQLKISELEKELHKQRERSLQILADKQKQIEEQKSRLEMLKTTDNETSQRCNSSSYQTNNTDVTDTVSNLIQIHSPAGPDGPLSPFGVDSSCAILHYVSEQARRDQELSQLRKQKTQLEHSMRQIQENSILKQQSYSEEIASLKMEIARHERNKNRESANLEYLKNVVLCYLQSQDYSIRQQMLNTISSILQFSPTEKSSVEKLWSWWGSSTTSSTSHSQRH